jgi:hypothetical protein
MKGLGCKVRKMISFCDICQRVNTPIAAALQDTRLIYRHLLASFALAICSDLYPLVAEECVTFLLYWTYFLNL